MVKKLMFQISFANSRVFSKFATLKVNSSGAAQANAKDNT